MQFGFVLLESLEGGNHEDPCSYNGLLGLEALSIQMLKTLFEVHDMARNEVVSTSSLIGQAHPY